MQKTYDEWAIPPFIAGLGQGLQAPVALLCSFEPLRQQRVALNTTLSTHVWACSPQIYQTCHSAPLWPSPSSPCQPGVPLILPDPTQGSSASWNLVDKCVSLQDSCVEILAPEKVESLTGD